MHERKTKMADLSDGFIALPGGAGTLEEIFEQWTWAQLGIHQKPCAFLNVAGFYEDLLKMIQGTVDNGFSQARFVDKLITSDKMKIFFNNLSNIRLLLRNGQMPTFNHK
jgi:uncharacterized protein (TIGR00730 family)